MAQIILTAQNVDIYEGDGRDPFARTGAISASMLVNAGAEGVILGHPETRDSVEMVHGKVLAVSRESALKHVTVMIGEDWGEFTGHSDEEVAAANVAKLMTILERVPDEWLERIVIGYDPKWGSRGNGHDDDEPPSKAYISACAKAIKGALSSTFGTVAANVPVIYGGRSTPQRTEEILADPKIDGLILGSACNTVQKTLDIATAMQKAMGSRRKILHANFKAYDLPDSYDAYIAALRKLDDSFVVYLSPNYVDLRLVRKALA